MPSTAFTGCVTVPVILSSLLRLAWLCPFPQFAESPAVVQLFHNLHTHLLNSSLLRSACRRTGAIAASPISQELLSGEQPFLLSHLLETMT